MNRNTMVLNLRCAGALLMISAMIIGSGALSLQGTDATAVVTRGDRAYTADIYTMEETLVRVSEAPYTGFMSSAPGIPFEVSGTAGQRVRLEAERGQWSTWNMADGKVTASGRVLDITTGFTAYWSPLSQEGEAVTGNVQVTMTEYSGDHIRAVRTVTIHDDGNGLFSVPHEIAPEQFVPKRGLLRTVGEIIHQSGGTPASRDGQVMNVFLKAFESGNISQIQALQEVPDKFGVDEVFGMAQFGATDIQRLSVTDTQCVYQLTGVAWGGGKSGGPSPRMRTFFVTLKTDTSGNWKIFDYATSP